MASSFPEAMNHAGVLFPALESRKVRYSKIYQQHCHRVYSLAFWMTDNELAADQLAALRLGCGVVGGGDRYACCAVDALGLAPMVGQRVEIRSRCHHCGTPLEVSATPAGPEPEADGVMLWIGARADDRRKVADSL